MADVASQGCPDGPSGSKRSTRRWLQICTKHVLSPHKFSKAKAALRIVKKQYHRYLLMLLSRWGLRILHQPCLHHERIVNCLGFLGRGRRVRAESRFRSFGTVWILCPIGTILHPRIFGYVKPDIAAKMDLRDQWGRTDMLWRSTWVEWSLRLGNVK